MRRIVWILALLSVISAVLGPMAVWAAEMKPEEARKAYAAGNYKDAYDALAPKVMAAEGTDALIDDYRLCLAALNSLGRVEEMDAFREKAIEAHAKDWTFL